MQVKIFKPTKNSMQSAIQKDQWVMQGKSKGKFPYDNGWTSSDNMSDEINLVFSSKESAIDFATSNYFEYEVIEPPEHQIKKRSYAQNFTKKPVVGARITL